jgi:hypothetical protein
VPGANPILSRLAVSRNPSPLAAATAAPGVCLLRFAWESAAGSLVGAVVGYGNDTLVPFPVPVPVRLGFLRPVRREWLVVLDSFNSILQFGVIAVSWLCIALLRFAGVRPEQFGIWWYNSGVICNIAWLCS